MSWAKGVTMKKMISKLSSNLGIIVVVLSLVVVIAVIYNARQERNEQIEMMTSWIGEHYFELMDEWGPPNDVIIDENGKIVIDYSYHEDLGERVRFCERYFYANSDGTIYNFKWKDS